LSVVEIVEFTAHPRRQCEKCRVSDAACKISDSAENLLFGVGRLTDGWCHQD